MCDESSAKSDLVDEVDGVDSVKKLLSRLRAPMGVIFAAAWVCCLMALGVVLGCLWRLMVWAWAGEWLSAGFILLALAVIFKFPRRWEPRK